MIAFTLAELCRFTQCKLAGPTAADAAADAADAASAAADAAGVSAASAASAGVAATGAASAAGAAAGQEVEIKHVSTSSKDITAGDQTLFIPLKGERFDGHDFILDALRAGACAFATHKSEDELLAAMDSSQQQEYKRLRVHCYVLQCADTLRFLGQCGELVRQKSHALIGAITGSCGKTTVKEMSAAILSQCAKTLFTAGNFNNDVGVPLTLLRLKEHQPYAIVEQGASHLQDIARTAEFVEADFALITNVGDAHILGFGSHEGVYHGKSEILDHLYYLHPVAEHHVVQTPKSEREVGIGIVPADNEWWPQWQQDYAAALKAGKLLSFGEHADATMQVSQIEEKAESISFHLHCKDERFPLDADFTLQMLGRHNAINAAGAALLALVMGADAEAVKQGLEVAQLIKGRLTPQHFGLLTVIDDAYNASFNAVLAAIDTLNKQEGLRILILGDMGELGNDEIALHEAVGRHAQNKIDLLLCIGPLSQYCVQAMGHQACHFLRHGDLIQVLQARVAEALAMQRPVCCLVKGSHAMHMEQVVSALQELGKQRLPQAAGAVSADAASTAAASAAATNADTSA